MAIVTTKAFFRSPKGQLTIVLGLLAIGAMIATGLQLSAPTIGIAMLTAMVIDAPFIRWREGEWEYPSGALLTGLIIGMILSPHEPLLVVAVASAIAILSKHALRTHSANIFNPAALGLLAVFFLFAAEQSWWGALPDLPIWAVVFVAAGGLYMCQRLNKMPVVLSFLGFYFGAFSVAAFLGDPNTVWEVFRAPDLQAVMYLSLFMVSDPPTSPPKAKDQVIFGAIAALGTVAAYMWLGGAWYLLGGVLVANIVEAGRRVHLRRQKAVARAAR
jgi:Na+-translocating ferredoxin:NAD+ oxidoreductase RnfD subunit